MAYLGDRAPSELVAAGLWTTTDQSCLPLADSLFRDVAVVWQSVLTWAAERAAHSSAEYGGDVDSQFHGFVDLGAARRNAFDVDPER